MFHRIPAAAVAAGIAFTTACSSSPDGSTTAAADGAVEEIAYSVAFEAVVGAQPFACSGDLGPIGTGKTTFRAVDFRFWVHDLVLLRAGGEAVPLRLSEERPTKTLADDGAWQTGKLALVDFEDATGTCAGTPETRTFVRGFAPRHDDYVGIELKVGVPVALNHVDAPSSPYPLGAPGMAWQWKSGYRFVRLDVSTPTHDRFYFHLGSSACTGALDGPDGFTCATENVATVRLDGFRPGSSIIQADIATVYAGLDVEAQTTTACMSGGTDNVLCPSMFGAFGLPYGTGAAPATQSFFRVK